MFVLQCFSALFVEAYSQIAIKIELQMQYKVPFFLNNIFSSALETFLHFLVNMSKDLDGALYWTFPLTTILNGYFYFDEHLDIVVKFKVDFRVSELLGLLNAQYTPKLFRFRFVGACFSCSICDWKRSSFTDFNLTRCGIEHILFLSFNSIHSYHFQYGFDYTKKYVATF